jgi:hypothetical protein
LDLSSSRLSRQASEEKLLEALSPELEEKIAAASTPRKQCSLLRSLTPRSEAKVLEALDTRYTQNTLEVIKQFPRISDNLNCEAEVSEKPVAGILDI